MILALDTKELLNATMNPPNKKYIRQINPQGAIGFLLRTGEHPIMNIPDVVGITPYIPFVSETRSELIVPLFFDGELLGVLILEAERRNYFDRQIVPNATNSQKS